MALKGMERTTLGITAGLAILAAAIQYLHPHFWDTSAMACPFHFFKVNMRDVGTTGKPGLASRFSYQACCDG